MTSNGTLKSAIGDFFFLDFFWFLGQNWYPVGVSGLETLLVRFLLKNDANDGVKSEFGAILTFL